MKNINLKNWSRQTKEEIVKKQNKTFDLFKNSLKILFVTLFIIVFYYIMAISVHDLIQGYSHILKTYKG